jgi:hypothetical protein
MRSISWTLPGWLLLILTSSVSAQTVPVLYQASVNKPTAEVRSQPSNDGQTYDTNTLRYHDLVSVVRELGDGWLQIFPPQGSFSWINGTDVSTISPNYPNNLVVKQTTSIFVGAEKTSGSRGTVLGAKALQGSQVVRVPRPTVKDADGEWIPIQPPHDEFRYIRMELVDKVGPGGAPMNPVPAYQPGLISQNSAFTPGYATSALPPPVPGAIPQPRQLTDAQQLWQRAQQAERVGNINEAVQLYSQLASQTSGPEQDLYMRALYRANWLRESQRNPVVQTIPTIQPRSVPATTASEVRYGNGVTSPDPARSGVQLNPPTAGTQPFATAVQPTPTPNSSSASPWQPVTPAGYPSSGPGRLRRAGRFLENRKTYVLESSQNYPILYVTPHTGIDLEPFVDRNVELFGPAIYRGDLRTNYMTVVRVQPLP